MQITGSLTPSSSEDSNKVHVDLKISRGTITPINPMDAARELRVSERALSDAKAGLPLKHAGFPSAVESDVQNYVAQRVTDYIQWGNARAQYCDNTMNSSSINAKIVLTLQNTVNKFKGPYLKEWLVQHSVSLKTLKDQFDISNDELIAFRKKNNLPVRPYKKSANALLWSIVIIIILILIETVINAGLFAQGLETGALGGVVTAAIAAFVNVMMSWYLFAQLFRGMQIRCATTTKYFKIGLGITLVWVIFEIALSFGVAHYRDALEMYAAGGFQEDFNPALVAAKNYFTPLRDLLSWALWIVTLAFGSIAYIDGIFMREPFPGYAIKFQQTENLKEQYEEELGDALEDLTRVHDETVNEITQNINDINTSFKAFSNAVTDKKSAETQFLNAIATSKTAYQTLIKEYQNTNIQYRSEDLRNEIPSYFSESIDLNASGIWNQTLPSFDSASDMKRLKEQQELKTSVQQELQELIELVHNATDEVIKPYVQGNVRSRGLPSVATDGVIKPCD